MKDIYDRGRALAARMLAPRSRGGKGLEMVLRVTGPAGKYDPVAGGAGQTGVDHEGSAVRADYDQRDIDGTAIKVGDVKFLVSPLKLDGSDLPKPKTKDRITFAGTTYSVEHCKPWDYAGVACGYEVQARAL